MAKNIPQAFIDDVIARTDIVELIQARVAIKKKGHNYLGLCPFHQEKSPSFSVNPQKQFYYCFGCGASGNAISFLMNYDHRSFIDAITDLSSTLGLEVPLEQNPQGPDRQRDYALLEQAAHYYQQELKRSPAAIDYLKRRGLTGQVAKQFALGFAPAGWEHLIQAMTQVGFTFAELEQNGLIVKKEQGGGYDRFRQRVMFPIRDARGRVIAFGARTLGNDTPKYLNSPETPLFQKNQELYGLYEALQHHHSPGAMLIVEGYMDVIALHQHGITQAVATLGTATNPKHLQRLLRYTNEVVFCFDGDNAGRNAAFKAVIMSLPLMRDGIQLRFMFLNADDDPDTLVRRVGKDGFLQRLQKAEPLSTVFFELLKQQTPLNSPDSKALYAKKATDYLNQMPAGLFKELMLEQLAKTLEVYVRDLETLAAPPKTATSRPKPSPQGLLNPAQQAIALLLQEPKLAKQGVEPDAIAQLAVPGASLLSKLLAWYAEYPQLTVGELLGHLDDPAEQQEVAQLAARRYPFASMGIIAEFAGAIERLHAISLENELQQLIEKSKQISLSPIEKLRLTELLSQRAQASTT